MAGNRSAAVAERFGANLRRARRREGLSQNRLAVGASVDRTEIGRLEAGERACRIDTLIRLAGVMAVPPAELLDGIAWVPAPEAESARRPSRRRKNRATEEPLTHYHWVPVSPPKRGGDHVQPPA